ncbi:hypothetical protein ACEPAI_4335 [Sanghuangporus weigelae]
MEDELRRRLHAYRKQRTGMRHTIASQAKEIQRLRTVVNYLVSDSERNNINDLRADVSEEELSDVAMEGIGDSSIADDSGSLISSDLDDMSTDRSVEGLPEAFWDGKDEIYRCSACFWEVSEGICEHCATEHAVDDEQSRFSIDNFSSISTAHESFNPDRCLRLRGTTPLREVDNPRELSGYSKDEYNSLIARGATRQMCETFFLEFTQEKGIVAWADDELFKSFSGMSMKNGDNWKIYLGRRIHLDEDDIDGAQFIEDLLEEVLLFPSSHLRGPLGLERAKREMRWVTEQESRGIWATRPVVEEHVSTCTGQRDCPCMVCDDKSDSSTDQLDITDKTLFEEEDDALECTLPRENLGPVIEFDEYETESEERVDERIGWTGIYDAGLDEAVTSTVIPKWTGELMISKVILATCDFDSLEELSGDEDVLRRR